MSSGRFALAFAFCTAIASNALQAQVQPIKLNGRSTCAACRIERYTLATITDAAFPGGAIQQINEVSRNRDGSFFLMSQGMGGPQHLYAVSAAGVVTTQIGREGRGPGEYVSPSAVTETADAYLVFDPRIGRITWLSKKDLKPMRSAVVPAQVTRVITFRDGRSVALGTRRIKGSASATITVLAADGSITSGFRPHALPSPRGPDDPVIIAASGDTAFIVASTLRYRIEKWDLNGKLLAVYERDVPWFQPFDMDEKTFPGQKAAWLDGIAEDAQGHIWVSIMRRTYAGPTDTGKQFTDADTRNTIEVLDPRSGSAIASLDVPGKNYLMPGGFFDVTLKDADEPAIGVSGYRLVTSGNTKKK